MSSSETVAVPPLAHLSLRSSTQDGSANKELLARTWAMPLLPSPPSSKAEKKTARTTAAVILVEQRRRYTDSRLRSLAVQQEWYNNSESSTAE